MIFQQKLKKIFFSPNVLIKKKNLHMLFFLLTNTSRDTESFYLEFLLGSTRVSTRTPSLSPLSSPFRPPRPRRDRPSCLVFLLESLCRLDPEYPTFLH